MIDIKVPAVGESISEVTLVKWLKQEGQYVERDEVIAELESEKATFEVNAEKAGILKTVGKEGDMLKIGDVVAQIDETAVKPEAQPAVVSQQSTEKKASSNGSEIKTEIVAEKPAPKTVAAEVKATPVASAII